MPKINVLSKQVAELIAAGEVVERPASVVKELIENSIDAGATVITVEIKNGGVKYIRVTDNGCGISPEDIRNAFVSHATSKVFDVQDLNSIVTLGFRGEALASVCAVSCVEVLTKTKDRDIGISYKITGGEELSLEEAGCPTGTTIVVRDLFYNTPARMKFLKKDVSEANAVAGVVDRLALSHPEISFRFIREGKETLFSPGDGKLESTAYSVFGKEFADSLLPVSYELDAVKISGFVSKPEASRPNRSMQFFFVNKRLIKTGTGAAALSEAYKNSIMAGKFPACVLNIDISPLSVDVNVHPAKIEVRFANEKDIFNAIFYAVKNAVTGTNYRPKVDLQKSAVKKYFNVLDTAVQTKLPEKKENFWSTQKACEFSANNSKNYISDKKSETIHKEATTVLRDSSRIKPLSEEKPSTLYTGVNKAQPMPENNEKEIIVKKPDIQADYSEPEALQEDVIIIGEAFKTYILAQVGQSMLIIDKHAAHERIIFEQLKSEERDNSSQLLLMPVTVTLNKDEYSAVLENLEALTNAGYDVQDFGSGMVIVHECPMALDSQDISQVIMELAGHLLENRHELLPEKLDWIYHSTACRAAIKAGDFTSKYEQEFFVKKLLSMPDIRYCPHGRPVLIEMTRKEMEKSFGRV